MPNASVAKGIRRHATVPAQGRGSLRGGGVGAVPSWGSGKASHLTMSGARLPSALPRRLALREPPTYEMMVVHA